jgi:hypothetical protein
MKRLGFPMSLWEEVSKRSKKNKPSECARLWGKMVPSADWTLGGMVPLAKLGNPEMFDRILPTLNLTINQAEDDAEYKPTLIDTPSYYLKSKRNRTRGRTPLKP